MDVTGLLDSWWQAGQHALAVSVFIRLLGAVFFLAFASLMVQLRGLFGRKGILPVRDYLAMLKRIGWKRFYYAPSVFWLGSGDAALFAACAAGMAAGISAALGVLVIPALALAWVCYLSFKSVGQDFLGFQWDGLLLETGFASMIAVASGFHPMSVLLLWFLFLKFMLTAGMAKLTSHDPTWRSLTAMTFHYQTQPLPNPLSWYAHNMPLWFHKLSVAGMLAIEIIVPFLIFGPPEARTFAFVMEALLQLAIMLTGNFGALNILTLVLGVPLLGDGLLSPLEPLRIQLSPLIPDLATAALCLGLIGLGLIHIVSSLSGRRSGSRILRAFEPFEISNGYGLFAVMTTRRYEVALEWSMDGNVWHEYRFRWKPQALGDMPRLSMPHMPRLDWLMWFLPFGPYDSFPWFMRLIEKLLQNSPDVMALFRSGPSDPPRLVRALLYEYSFTTPEERKRSGKWWRRKLVGEYCPAYSSLDL